MGIWVTASELAERYVGSIGLKVPSTSDFSVRYVQGIRFRLINGSTVWSGSVSFDAGGTRPVSYGALRKGGSLKDAQLALDMIEGGKASATLEALLGDYGVSDEA